MVISTYPAIVEIESAVKILVKGMTITNKSRQIKLREFKVLKVIGAYFVFSSKISEKIGRSYAEFNVIRMA